MLMPRTNTPPKPATAKTLAPQQATGSAIFKGRSGPPALNSPLSDTIAPVTIAKKLGFKPGMVCAVIDPPNGMKHGLPVSTASEPELILAFAADRARRACHEHLHSGPIEIDGGPTPMVH